MGPETPDNQEFPVIRDYTIRATHDCSQATVPKVISRIRMTAIGSYLVGSRKATWGVYVNRIYSGLCEGTKTCLRVQNLGLYLISDNTARVKIQINYLPRPCKKEQRKQIK